jgi:hypothetical protein
MAAASLTTGLLATPAIMASTQQVQAQNLPPVDQSNLGSTLPLNQSPFIVTKAPDAPPAHASLSIEDLRAQFKDQLSKATSSSGHTLTAEEEAKVAAVVQANFGIKAVSELEGVTLNHQRGIVAGEQHLPLYPGDSIGNFYKNRITGQLADPTAHLTGMVPGLPSWGYFTNSAKTVTKQDVDREQWYIAAQTFLAPGFRENPNKLYNFFKYRKMIMINPDTGMAVVVDIGDAGPSPSTGRSFGANNPVLMATGLGRQRTGQVMVLFVDDPTDSIPLGPLTGTDL